MTGLIAGFVETLATLRINRDVKRFDGTEIQEAVLRHSAHIPGWEVARCRRYHEWPDRVSVGAPLPTAFGQNRHSHVAESRCSGKPVSFQTATNES